MLLLEIVFMCRIFPKIYRFVNMTSGILDLLVGGFMKLTL